MIRFSNTIDIRRQPAEVFRYLADLEHTPEWNWAIKRTQKVSVGEVGVGTRYQQTRSVPRPAVEMLEVTEFNADRQLRVVGDLGPFRADLTYEFAPTPTGTRLTNSVELDRAGLGILDKLLSARIQASVAENLGVLRTVLEGNAQAAAR